jgi:hypothetical protein
MPQVTDITSRKGRKGAKSKEDALERLGAKKDGDEDFTAGKDNPNIRKPGEPEDEKPARRTHRPKQEQLLDTAPVVPPSVKKAAQDYLDVLDERIALQQREPDLRQGLIDLMVHHECTQVRINGETLTLETIRKVKKTTDKDGE